MDRETLERAADVLRDAYDILLRDGVVCGGDDAWNKSRDGGPTCLEFAVAEALGFTPGCLGVCEWSRPVAVAVFDVLPKMSLDGVHEYPWVWNDEPGRTPDEVLDALLEGEKRLREQAAL